MKNDEVVQRYSRALFNLEGSKQKRLELLLGLLHVCRQTPKLITCLTSPLVSKKDKVALIEQAIGSKEDEKLFAFFSLIIDSHRSKFIPAIIEDYRKRVNESLGLIEIILRTAVPIDANEKERFRTKLESLHKRPVQIKEKVDPSIIGGVILAYGNKMIDFSIRGRLETLRKQLCK
jgi:F-type H+-transporting ATPase subunit delta